MNFRLDINGLRAIAVIAVVLFHFVPEILPGGFAGVDVFFVISGYLMTKIIFTGIKNNNFDLFLFYIARVKRIVPTLAILCFSLLILGFFYLPAIDYALLSKHAASSVGFISNIIYVREMGYFDVGSLDKWLLHTWSLSVEWQFYIVYPLLLVALKSFFEVGTLRLVILFGGIISFIFCVQYSFSMPSAAFYLLPFRAWEMILGGLVFLYPTTLSKSCSKAIEVLGFIMIITSYFLFSEEVVWPGYLATVPVIGSMLILWSNSNSNLTNNIVFQKIGSASYSIYLWHWPVVVTLNYLLLDSLGYKIAGIAFAFILGFLSYHLIELKLAFKLSQKSFRSFVFYTPNIMVFVVSIASGIIYLGDGYNSRFKGSAVESIVRSPYAYKCRGRIGDPNCKYFNDNTKWATLGNSHAVELSYTLAERLKNDDIGLQQFTSNGCPIVYKYTIDDKCVNWTNAAVSEIINDNIIENVVVSYRITSSLFGDNIEHYPNLPDEAAEYGDGLSKHDGREKLLSSFSELITDLANNKKKVFVILPIPELSENINKKAFRELVYGLKIDTVNATSVEYYLRRNAMVRDYLLNYKFSSNVVFIDPLKLFCDDIQCYAFKGGEPLYFDDDHPSVEGSRIIANEILKEHSN